MIQMHQDDASDEASRPLGIEAEIKICNGSKVWLHLIENWSLINRMIKPLIVQ